jgi:hypothetical protein
MFRFTLRDVLYLLALAVLTGVWWLDRSMLANSLKNCRFAVEHQRAAIEALSEPAKP